ncbi:hypothetical protein KFE25_005047 [Diacronema lutheri]|uniref:Uncharacterized protein n=1 Tax=Diacronema lutheri TaxID=2081491 RepID=A0A8J5X3F3_DIALT|nr:hypothetical protein KFE25_005047 [Diacronema lutheri]
MSTSPPLEGDEPTTAGSALRGTWHDAEDGERAEPPLPPPPPPLPLRGVALARLRLAHVLLLLVFGAASLSALVLGCLWARTPGGRGWGAAMLCVLCGSALVSGWLALVWGEVEPLPTSPDSALATVLLGATLWLGRAASTPADQLRPAARLAALSTLADGSFRFAPLLFTLALAESADVPPPPLPALRASTALLALCACVGGLVPSAGGAPHDESRAEPARTRAESAGAALLVPAALGLRALALAFSREVGGEGGACATALAAVAAAAGARAVAVRCCAAPTPEVCTPGVGALAFGCVEAFALALSPQAYPVAAPPAVRLCAELAVGAVCACACAACLGASRGADWRPAVRSGARARGPPGALSLADRTEADAARRLALVGAVCACAALQACGAALLYARRARAELRPPWRRPGGGGKAGAPPDEPVTVRVGSFHLH